MASHSSISGSRVCSGCCLEKPMVKSVSLKISAHLMSIKSDYMEEANDL